MTRLSDYSTVPPARGIFSTFPFTAMAPSLYDAVKGKVHDSTTTHRVEVNQRALIDKILARYASAGAVYRELLQNSNDADATRGEIDFTVNESNVVTSVEYKNNGMPFRPQDWDRLQKIAEGNPDEKKSWCFWGRFLLRLFGM